MRAASPTGGALGQVSERELGFLQSVIGSLEQSQGREQFLENLGRVEGAFNDVIHGPQGGQSGGAPVQSPGMAGTPGPAPFAASINAPGPASGAGLSEGDRERVGMYAALTPVNGGVKPGHVAAQKWATLVR